MDKKINILKILDNLDSGKDIPKKEELGLNNWEYGDLLDSMIGEYISGEPSQRAGTMGKERNSSNDDRIILGFGSFIIKLAGIEYLEKNK